MDIVGYAVAVVAVGVQVAAQWEEIREDGTLDMEEVQCPWRWAHS